MKVEKRFCKHCKKYTLHDFHKEEEENILGVGLIRIATIGGLFWDRDKWYECQECGNEVEIN